MLIISDLTRDIRPKLKDILIQAIKDTVALDRNRINNDGPVIKIENDTFYYRVLVLFMQRAVLCYTNDEIETWSKVELLNEAVLPKIEGYELMDNQ